MDFSLWFSSVNAKVTRIIEQVSFITLALVVYHYAVMEEEGKEARRR